MGLGRTGVEQLSQKYFSALAGCSLHLRLIVSMQCGIGLRDESKLKPTHRTIETHHGWMHIQQDYSVLSHCCPSVLSHCCPRLTACAQAPPAMGVHVCANGRRRSGEHWRRTSGIASGRIPNKGKTKPTVRQVFRKRIP